MLFGLFVAILTTNIPIGPAYSAVVPKVFPWLISGALILIGLMLLIESLRETEPSDRPVVDWRAIGIVGLGLAAQLLLMTGAGFIIASPVLFVAVARDFGRSEEHTPELQSLMRHSYRVCCLHKTTQSTHTYP